MTRCHSTILSHGWNRSPDLSSQCLCHERHMSTPKLTWLHYKLSRSSYLFSFFFFFNDYYVCVPVFKMLLDRQSEREWVFSFCFSGFVQEYLKREDARWQTSVFRHLGCCSLRGAAPYLFHKHTTEVYCHTQMNGFFGNLAPSPLWLLVTFCTTKMTDANQIASVYFFFFCVFLLLSWTATTLKSSKRRKKKSTV